MFEHYGERDFPPPLFYMQKFVKPLSPECLNTPGREISPFLLAEVYKTTLAGVFKHYGERDFPPPLLYMQKYVKPPAREISPVFFISIGNLSREGG